MDPAGKVAMVTGGAQGIGASYCSYLLANKAKVIICDVNQSVGTQAIKQLRSEYGVNNVEFYLCDVTNLQQFQECFEKAIKQFGQLDILVNNAGVINETENGWLKMIDINLAGTVRGTKLGLKYMSKQNGGRGGLIVNIGSIVALSVWETVPVYSATKAGVIHLSRCYGSNLHYKSSGVKVIAINPGLTNTSILHDAKENTLSDQARVKMEADVGARPIQNVENMGKGLIQVIRKAESGSVWTIEYGEEPKPTELTNAIIKQK